MSLTSEAEGALTWNHALTLGLNVLGSKIGVPSLNNLYKSLTGHSELDEIGDILSELAKIEKTLGEIENDLTTIEATLKNLEIEVLSVNALDDLDHINSLYQSMNDSMAIQKHDEKGVYLINRATGNATFTSYDQYIKSIREVFNGAISDASLRSRCESLKNILCGGEDLPTGLLADKAKNIAQDGSVGIFQYIFMLKAVCLPFALALAKAYQITRWIAIMTRTKVPRNASTARKQSHTVLDCSYAEDWESSIHKNLSTIQDTFDKYVPKVIQKLYAKMMKYKYVGTGADARYEDKDGLYPNQPQGEDIILSCRAGSALAINTDESSRIYALLEDGGFPFTFKLAPLYPPVRVDQDTDISFAVMYTDPRRVWGDRIDREHWLTAQWAEDNNPHTLTACIGMNIFDNHVAPNPAVGFGGAPSQLPPSVNIHYDLANHSYTITWFSSGASANPPDMAKVRHGHNHGWVWEHRTVDGNGAYSMVSPDKLDRTNKSQQFGIALATDYIGIGFGPGPAEPVPRA